MSQALLEAANMPIPKPDAAHLNVDTQDLDWAKLGMPLLPFSNSDIVSKHWSQISGQRAKKRMVLFPFAALHSLDEMKKADGFVAAVSNQLYLNLPASDANVVVLASGEVKIRPGFERLCELTSQDKRFIASVESICLANGEEGSQYVGSDGWVREQFQEYLAGLLSCLGHVEEMFEVNPRSLNLTPELLEFGAPFVHEFMQTSCFARWLHSADSMYILIGDLVMHPSGPPCDTLDHLADGASELQQDISEAAQKAKKKLSRFFASVGSGSGAHEISEPINDPERAAANRSDFEEGLVTTRIKNWWSSGGSNSDVKK